jgi:hypothetical protein
MPSFASSRAIALVLLSLFAAPAAADRVVTADGRVIELPKARRLESGDYRLVFESGEVVCPGALIASIEMEGDMSDYVPANADEEKKLADGYVRYRGKWMSKSAYLAEQKKQSEAAKARTAELLAHASFYDGWKKQTKHFEIQSNTSPEILDHYAELLEAYYDLMDKRVGIDPSPMLKKQRMKVNIYKNRPEFTELTRKDPGVAGFFNFVDGELHFYHDYDEPSQSEWIALHEGTHLLTFLVEPQARPWIWVNEGVADYYGASQIERDTRGKLVIEPGQLLLERVLTVQQAIRDETFVQLERLFFIPQGDEFRAFEYAHAWSFVYFLHNAKPAYEKAFKKFFEDVYTLAKGVEFTLQPSNQNKYGAWKTVSPQEVRRVLLARLGLKDTVALEEEWKTFIAAIPIDAPKARFMRGIETLYGDPDGWPAAREDIEAALAGGVTDARAYWARGLLAYLLEGERDAAVADYREAVTRAPLEAGYRTTLAQALAGLPPLGDLPVEIDLAGLRLLGSEDELGEAEMHFGLACELAPDDESLRESRDTFHELLVKHAGGGK